MSDPVPPNENAPTQASLSVRLTRRAAAFGLLAFTAGCASREDRLIAENPGLTRDLAAHYGPRPNETHPLPPLELDGIDTRLLKQDVPYPGRERPGTVVVDRGDRFLYLVQPGGRAIRYGVGVGREGMRYAGSARIGRKAEWPRWTPTANMIAYDPRNAEWAGGKEGGLGNPLGARALYLYEGSRDTMFRIHGTTEPETIGTAVSSGCIRMFNHDVIDLYDRVATGTPVLVRA
jgi:lipoprotein-anchoring transpeptidase ErfK/SrfK